MHLSLGNPEIVGSNPSLATKKMKKTQILKFEMEILEKQIRVLWKHIKKLEVERDLKK